MNRLIFCWFFDNSIFLHSGFAAARSVHRKKSRRFLLDILESVGYKTVPKEPQIRLNTFNCWLNSFQNPPVYTVPFQHHRKSTILLIISCDFIKQTLHIADTYITSRKRLTTLILYGELLCTLFLLLTVQRLLRGNLNSVDFWKSFLSTVKGSISRFVLLFLV